VITHGISAKDGTIGFSRVQSHTVSTRSHFIEVVRSGHGNGYTTLILAVVEVKVDGRKSGDLGFRHSVLLAANKLNAGGSLESSAELGCDTTGEVSVSGTGIDDCALASVECSSTASHLHFTDTNASDGDGVPVGPGGEEGYPAGLLASGVEASVGIRSAESN